MIDVLGVLILGSCWLLTGSLIAWVAARLKRWRATRRLRRYAAAQAKLLGVGHSPMQGAPSQLHEGDYAAVIVDTGEWAPLKLPPTRIPSDGQKRQS